MVFAHRAVLALGFAAVGLAVPGRAGEIRWVEGYRGWTANNVVQWTESGSFFPAALLDDPRSIVPADSADRIVTGDTGTTVPATGQIPGFTVSEVLPAFWAQPSVWFAARHGPTAFAEMGNGWEARDFAGRPATDRRASRWDNGSEARVAMFPTEIAGIPTGEAQGTPSRAVVQPEVRLVQIEQQTAPGQAFDVGSSTAFDGRYAVIFRVISGPDGHLVFSVPLTDGDGFFRLTPLADGTP